MSKKILKNDVKFQINNFTSKPSWKDGTTATVILIINRTLYSANIGDSKVCSEKLLSF